MIMTTEQLLEMAEARAARAEQWAATWKRAAKLWKEASEGHHRSLLGALSREKALEQPVTVLARAAAGVLGVCWCGGDVRCSPCRLQDALANPAVRRVLGEEKTDAGLR